MRTFSIRWIFSAQLSDCYASEEVRCCVYLDTGLVPVKLFYVTSLCINSVQYNTLQSIYNLFINFIIWFRSYYGGHTGGQTDIHALRLISFTFFSKRSRLILQTLFFVGQKLKTDPSTHNNWNTSNLVEIRLVQFSLTFLKLNHIKHVSRTQFHPLRSNP